MFTLQKVAAVAMLASSVMAYPKEVEARKEAIPTVYRTDAGPLPPNFNASRIPIDIGARSVSQVCISIAAGADWWHYANTGVWGTATGTFGSLPNGKLCVPTNNQAGGAFYIGAFANPGPGSTKFECYFPTSGNAYCDISVVDGYSLSMTCGAGGQGGPIWGGGGSFFAQGNACPKSDGERCINTKGYAPSQSDVDAFFQYGVQGKNQYCIWKNCPIPGVYDVSSTIGCYVTAGGY